MNGRSMLAAVGDTPLVHLEATSPPDGAAIYVKWEGANPTGSMKDRMALAMIRGARDAGELDAGHPVVEYTGGSTGSSLALVCSVLGHPLTLVTADCFSTEKIRTMEALGATVEVLETPDGTVYPGLIDEMNARVLAIVDETGAYHTNQFENERQRDGYREMGEEILRDCPGVTDFVAAVGTGGCAMGNATALKAARDVHVTLVEPTESPYLSTGEGGSHSVEGIAVAARPPLLDDVLYDDVLAIPEATAVETARRVASEDGLFGGVSTGINVAAALQVARERSPDDAVVTVACDTGLKYLAGSLYA